MWEALVASAAAFAGTNIDDLFLLMMLFAQANSRSGKGRIAAGQYLGIVILTVVSLLCAFGLARIPHYYIRCLGLVPIALGLRAWWKREAEDEAADCGCGVFSMAALTVANGADNLGVYIPLFAGYTGAQLAVTAVVFAVMCGLWCLLGTKLAALPRVQSILRRWKTVLVPTVLILLGLSILLF